ncbi:MAG: BMC domain-containing protein [Myxococcota bacterium]|nr:BMC domain-containing protein [Myxococcota bacterium]
MGQDALALVELTSVARGYRVVDALVKKAPVQVLEANLVEPGVFRVLFTGGVAEVELAFEEAMSVAGDSLRDRMFLPLVHEAVVPALGGQQHCEGVDALGILEGRMISSTLEACDRALKDARVELAGIRITPALGGKAFFVVHGPQHDVEAAISAATGILMERGNLVRSELIPRPHEDFMRLVLRPAPFQVES